MAEFTPVQLHFPPVDGLTVPEDFDNGALSSDFGPLILRGVDRQIGLTERVAAALDDQRHPSHITSKLARRGYTTIAITAFQDIFFKLRSWYPQIGFQQMYFGEELQPKMARSCGAV